MVTFTPVAAWAPSLTTSTSRFRGPSFGPLAAALKVSLPTSDRGSPQSAEIFVHMTSRLRLASRFQASQYRRAFSMRFTSVCTRGEVYVSTGEVRMTSASRQ
jgi:hypothetical protein